MNYKLTHEKPPLSSFDWLSFMDDVDALAAERSAGGE